MGGTQVTSREPEAGPIGINLYWEQCGQGDSGGTEKPVISSHRHSAQDVTSRQIGP